MHVELLPVSNTTILTGLLYCMNKIKNRILNMQLKKQLKIPFSIYIVNKYIKFKY